MKTFKDFINDGKTVNEAQVNEAQVNEAQYFTIPNRVVGNQVYALMKRTKEMYDWLKAGNDFKQEDMEQIERLIAVIKNQVKLITEEQRIEEKYEVEVSVRDARKANDIANDVFRGEYRMDGSNVFVFKKKSSKEDFLDELESRGIEVLEEAHKLVSDRNLKVTSGQDNLHIGVTGDKLEFMVNMKEAVVVTSPADIKAIKDHIAKA